MTWAAEEDSVDIFTHSTIVQSQRRLRRARLLPYPGDVVVSQGQMVEAVQVVARARKPGGIHIVPAGELLGAPAEKIRSYLAVEPGAEVQQGDLLLEKKRRLGRRRVEAPVDGIVLGVHNGRVILQQAEWIEMRAALPGRVANSVGNRGVVIETSGALVQGIWAAGPTGYGALKLLCDTPSLPLDAKLVEADVKEQIVVAGQVRETAVLEKLAIEGAFGLIVGSIPATLYPEARRAAIPVIVTDGLGEQGLAKPIFHLLRRHEGEQATLFTYAEGQDAEQGERRPEIIIAGDGATGPLEETRPELAPVSTGQTVRILRPPYWGRTGTVRQLYKRARPTDIGLRAHGALVEMDNAETVFVPFANLDTIS